MATNSTKPLNIKYGAKKDLPTTTLTDGTLYVATKDDNRAELHVGLDDKNYVISESLPTDNDWIETGGKGNNPVRKSLIKAEFDNHASQLESLSTGLAELQQTVEDECLKNNADGSLNGNLTVTGSLTVTSTNGITASTFNGNATSATTATTLSSVLPTHLGGTGATTPEGAVESLGLGPTVQQVINNTNNIQQANTNISTNTTAISGHNTRITALENSLGSGSSTGTVLSRLAAVEGVASDNTDDIEGLRTDLNKVKTTADNAVPTATYSTKISALEAKDTTLSNAINDITKTGGSLDVLSNLITANADNISTNTGSIESLTEALETTNDNLDDHEKDTEVHVTLTDKASWNDKAPKNHAVSNTTYGMGTGTNYGHVKLSDSLSSSGASSGIAATPKAVNDFKTEINQSVEDLAGAVNGHINDPEYHVFVGSKVEVGGNTPINADTLNGKTATQIIAEASGQTAEAGTVGFSTAVIDSGTDVTLTNVATGDALMPRTTVANVSGFDTAINNKLNGYMRFIISNTEPTSTADKKLGVIWFHGTGTGKHIIKIWNGSSWEAMNTWQ